MRCWPLLLLKFKLSGYVASRVLCCTVHLCVLSNIAPAKPMMKSKCAVAIKCFLPALRNEPFSVRCSTLMSFSLDCTVG